MSECVCYYLGEAIVVLSSAFDSSFRLLTGSFCNKRKKSLSESYARCSRSVWPVVSLVTSIVESLSTNE